MRGIVVLSIASTILNTTDLDYKGQALGVVCSVVWTQFIPNLVDLVQ